MSYPRVNAAVAAATDYSFSGQSLGNREMGQKGAQMVNHKQLFVCFLISSEVKKVKHIVTDEK